MALQFIFVTYQINVILTTCGFWLLQNLAKRKKSNKFNRLQTEMFLILNLSTPYISPLNIGPSDLSFACMPRVY